MLPPAMEGRIEDTVPLDLKYPSVIERYWTKHYFIPKDRRWQGGEAEEKGARGGNVGGGGEDVKGGGGLEKEGGVGSSVEEKLEKEGLVKSGKKGIEKEDDGVDAKTKIATEENGNKTEQMDIEYTETNAEKDDKSPEDDSSLGSQQQEEKGGGAPGQNKTPDSSGHVCVMVHTNKLCLVTLSPRHPALAPGMEITKVSYNVGRFNRLDNQVSGKGKRGAQMMGPQSPVCVITCADGSQHTVLAGVHGKLVEVNERLVTNPKLLSECPEGEGYLAVILPPLRNGDGPLKRLLTAEQYWGQER
ncbi:uncharacterized protein LOC126999294 [Eriocheir sinensis]|uniref:uncharacterized protein LOC126999294 n=1 Tax=Eriocheir sinensis TaxID=95602 RepID=UPI0021C570E1|nr:uncharacterized protein LOC126999294 [Eriocheir sinensis]